MTEPYASQIAQHPENPFSKGSYAGHLWRVTPMSRRECETGQFPQKYRDMCRMILALPNGSYWAQGLFGQFLIMIPSLDLVVLRMARDVIREDWAASPQFTQLVEALHRIRAQPWTNRPEPVLQMDRYWQGFLASFWWPPLLWLTVILATNHYPRIYRAKWRGARICTPTGACRAFAGVAVAMNLVRIYYFCLLTEAEAIFDEVCLIGCLVGILLLLGGQFVNALCYTRLGYQGIYYGCCFGLEIQWCGEFPYGTIRDPQYIATTASYFGYCLARGRLFGYSGVACVLTGLSYFVMGYLEAYLIPKATERKGEKTF